MDAISFVLGVQATCDPLDGLYEFRLRPCGLVPK